jgi:hypothetical protein
MAARDYGLSLTIAERVGHQQSCGHARAFAADRDLFLHRLLAPNPTIAASRR